MFGVPQRFEGGDGKFGCTGKNQIHRHAVTHPVCAAPVRNRV
jgi:hypothetical protein